MQDINFITEGDVYRLIAKSKLPEAEKFEKWVFDEVLPSIRRHGIYAVEEIINNPDFIIKALTELKNERMKNDALEYEAYENRRLIGELQPKAAYTDLILNNKGLVTITQIAKDYGMTGAQMNKLLRKKNVQYKQSGQWLLYSKHSKKGYVHS